MCSNYAEIPSIYKTSYIDFISNPSADFFVKIECFSNGSIPTNTTWWRNGIEVDVDGSSYQTVQIVGEQVSSYFQNTLLIKDMFEALGNHNYTCSIENQFGNDSGNIIFNKQGTFCCNFAHFTTNIFFQKFFLQHWTLSMAMDLL